MLHSPPLRKQEARFYALSQHFLLLDPGGFFFVTMASSMVETLRKSSSTLNILVGARLQRRW
jgi:hypothetical protein